MDFYCHAAGLVVEVDGPVHLEQIRDDAEREQVPAKRGLRVLRFKNEEVMQKLEQVLDRIRAACRPDRPLPNPPLPGECDGPWRDNTENEN